MIYVLILAISIAMSIFVKRYAITKQIIDTPNQRSSHTTPTPRGGGVAIVISFFVGVFYCYFANIITKDLFFALLCSIPLIIVGFLDDIYNILAKFRFLVQSISVILSLYFIGSDSIILNIFFAFGMLWLINLYNFLDGIDGYAISEAIFISLAAFVIFQNEIFLILCMATLGFLPFNWQRASIFMGDVGSTFLGFVFGVFVIYFSNDIKDFTIWLILLSLFWFDATFTLIKRFQNGENITTAHKKHLFQRAVQAGFSHQAVTLFALFINIGLFFIVFLFQNSKFLYFALFLITILLFWLTKVIDNKVAFK